MKHGVVVPVFVLMMFVAGCAEKQQVKVTFLSDPPGGTLYKQNGEPWGPCPKTLWFDLDEEAAEGGYLDAKGMVVRWPSGPEKESRDLIKITVNGTDRRVVFLQPKEEPKALVASAQIDENKKPDEKPIELQSASKLQGADTERAEAKPTDTERADTERAETTLALSLEKPVVPDEPLAKSLPGRVLTLTEQQLVLLDWHSSNRSGARVRSKRAVAGPGVEFDINFPSNRPGSCSLTFVSSGTGGRGSLVGTDIRGYEAFALKLTLVSINGDSSPESKQKLVVGAVIGPTAEGRLTDYKPVALSLAASEKTVTARTPLSADEIYEIGFHVHARDYDDWDPAGSRIVLRVEPAEDGRAWAFDSSKR